MSSPSKRREMDVMKLYVLTFSLVWFFVDACSVLQKDLQGRLSSSEPALTLIYQMQTPTTHSISGIRGWLRLCLQVDE